MLVEEKRDKRTDGKLLNNRPRKGKDLEYGAAEKRSEWWTGSVFMELFYVDGKENESGTELCRYI